jgi:hypothetical protein
MLSARLAHTRSWVYPQQYQNTRQQQLPISVLRHRMTVQMGRAEHILPYNFSYFLNNGINHSKIKFENSSMACTPVTSI